jgi:hypothetical protein
MRKLATVTVFMVALLAPFVLLPASVYADQWAPTVVPYDWEGVSIADQVYAVRGASFIAGGQLTASGVGPGMQMCSNYEGSGQCDLTTKGSTGAAQLVMGLCTAASQTNCIVSMSLGASPDALQPSTFVRSAQGSTVAADPSAGMPAGSTTGLWTNPLVNAGGTNTYATSVYMDWLINDGVFSPELFGVAILPYKQVSGQYKESDAVVSTSLEGQPAVGLSGGSLSCAWTENGLCGQFEDFAPITYASITLRVTNKQDGWFQGRLQDPSFSVSAYDATSNLVTVTAETVPTPTLAVGVPIAQADSSVQSLFSNWIYPPHGLISVEADTQLAAKAVGAFRTAAKNTASGVITQWNFGSYQAYTNSCLTDTTQLLGLITTNSMVYQGTTPSFSSGTLNYQVGGMHYLPDGSVSQGTYDLVMRDSVARCLYGFSNAPISATVSVTEDSSGNQNVATTSVSDKNGWLHVGAYGFNFSDPTVKVKLSQAAPHVAKVKKVTIACVSIRNKNLVRHVTAVRPRCPNGFRRR